MECWVYQPNLHPALSTGYLKNGFQLACLLCGVCVGCVWGVCGVCVGCVGGVRNARTRLGNNWQLHTLQIFL